MIRANLLIHSITYYEWTGNSGQDGEQYAAGVTIDKVRLEPISSVKGVSGGNEWIANTLLFYDLNISTEANIVEKSKIEFVNTQGKTETYYISKIDELYSRGRHHMEIYLK